jgi:hypothetical protein
LRNISLVIIVRIRNNLESGYGLTTIKFGCSQYHFSLSFETYVCNIMIGPQKMQNKNEEKREFMSFVETIYRRLFYSPFDCVEWWFGKILCSCHTFRNVADLINTEFYRNTGFCHWPSNWFKFALSSLYLSLSLYSSQSLYIT